MNKRTIFYGAIVLAVLFLVFAVYYIIPGIYHPFTASPPYESHRTHAVLFLVLAVVSVLVALVNRRGVVR